jgi:hypothetical protein
VETVLVLVNVLLAGNRTQGYPIIASGSGGSTVPRDVTLAGNGLGHGFIFWAGEANLDRDPLFVDAACGDYSLSAGLPCVDKGALSSAPAADIGGTRRDATPDMGAFEWTGYRLFLPSGLRDHRRQSGGSITGGRASA